ncbi:MAG: hypothetical protein HQ525_07195 [Anaerolineae bacterium]|nr:hypothetical protein [Anaerolineae bacterium]
MKSTSTLLLAKDDFIVNVEMIYHGHHDSINGAIFCQIRLTGAGTMPG